MKVVDIRTLVGTGDDQWYEMDVLVKGFFRTRAVTYVLNWWKDTRYDEWNKSWSLLDGTIIQEDYIRRQLFRLFEYHRVIEQVLVA